MKSYAVKVLSLLLAFSLGSVLAAPSVAGGVNQAPRQSSTDATRPIPPSLQLALFSTRTMGSAAPRSGGGALTWLGQQLSETSHPDYSQFGYTVAIDGDTALVGADTAAIGGVTLMGAVYVFTRAADGSWSKSARLDPDPEDRQRFGMALALQGDTAVVGAPWASIGGKQSQGAAYVFERSENGSWNRVAKLIASDGNNNEYFGDSVAIDKDTILIGALDAVVNGNIGQGAVYVFNEINGSWAESAKLVASDGQAGDEFGGAVAIAGSTAIIGAAYSSPNGHRWQGAAYVFVKSGNGWSQQGKVLSAMGQHFDSFGTSVAIDGTRAVVGAPCYPGKPGEDCGPGAAFVFVHSDGYWHQSAKLISKGGQDWDRFGEDVALNGQKVLVGAGDSGKAYLIKFDSAGSWDQMAEFSEEPNGFGHSVDLNEMDIIVGAPTSIRGGTYIYSQTKLGLAVSAPRTVSIDRTYVSQTIVTNKANTSSPAVTVAIPVPPAASFVQATVVPAGSCEKVADLVTCSLGHISGNAGSATTNVTLRATGSLGTTIRNVTNLVGAVPALTAVAPTQIVQNVPPTANDGELVTDENQAVSGTLSASDSDDDKLTFAIVSQPEHGVVELNVDTGGFTYKPEDGYSGNDSFTFKVNDGELDSNVATISITVNAVNHPPVANDGTLTTDKNKAVSGTLSASDPDGDTLTFAIVGQPEHGTVNLDTVTGAVTYTPTTGYSGSDSFTFKANDGQVDSNVATITVTVNAMNQPPVANDGTLTTDQNQAVSGTLSASDPDGDTLTFAIVGQPEHGTVSLDATTGVLTYTPTTGYSGSDSFTFKANDGQLDSNLATISINVEKATKNGGGSGGFEGFGIMMLLAMGAGAVIRRRFRRDDDLREK